MYRFKLHGHLLVFIKHPPISVGKVPKYTFWTSGWLNRFNVTGLRWIVQSQTFNAVGAGNTELNFTVAICFKEKIDLFLGFVKWINLLVSFITWIQMHEYSSAQIQKLWLQSCISSNQALLGGWKWWWWDNQDIEGLKNYRSFCFCEEDLFKRASHSLYN